MRRGGVAARNKTEKRGKIRNTMKGCPNNAIGKIEQVKSGEATNCEGRGGKCRYKVYLEWKFLTATKKCKNILNKFTLHEVHSYAVHIIFSISE